MYVFHLSTLNINLNKLTNKQTNVFNSLADVREVERKSVEKYPQINNRLDVQSAYVIKIDTNTEKKWGKIHPSKNRWATQ